MPRNLYFSEGHRPEQRLYEDLIIEAIKIYGIDMYYLPRSIVSRDTILNEEDAARFDDAYVIEMYVENVDGFEGEGVLLSKFGLELRDQATFIVAKREWENSVGSYEKGDLKTFQPSEGDLIYVPMSKSFFEIKLVEAQRPFYQLQDLPIYRLQAELFEYNDQVFDTDIEDIDDIERKFANATVLTIDLDSNGNTYEVGERVQQYIDTSTYVEAEVGAKDADTITVVNITASDDSASSFIVSSELPLVGLDSATSLDITVVDDDSFVNDDAAQNPEFETEGDTIIDFTENNPWGEV